MNKDGWLCQLMYPIDFDLVLERFELPTYIKINKSKNLIFCEMSWSEIVGNLGY